MNYGGISLEAYMQRGDGFNDASAADVQELNKAIMATDQQGMQIVGSTTASGAPLKVESLEKTLKVVTFSQKNIVFWKETPILPAYNTVEEFNRLTSYGSDQGGFTGEGELPEEADSTYVRESELVKYMGNTRVVTHPMTLVNTAHGAVIQREIENGTIWILSKVERALFEGNSSVIPEEFNGIYEQMQSDYSNEISFLQSTNVIDMRGNRMDDDSLETGSNSIIENYGYPTDIYWSPKTGADYAKNYFPRQRVMNPINNAGAQEFKAGARVVSFVSQAGEIPFHPDVFLRPKPAKTATSTSTSPKAPSKPLADAVAPVTPVAATVANTMFQAADNGTYLYAVSGLNRYGESGLTFLSLTPATIVTGGAAALKFSDGGGTYAASGFRIYRAAMGSAYSSTLNFYPIFDIGAADLAAGLNGGGAGVVYDLNLYLPNTSKALMLQKDLEFYSFKQLAPLMKMDLALLAPAYRFQILLYGTPIVYAPRKAVLYTNIGTSVNAATNALIA